MPAIITAVEYQVDRGILTLRADGELLSVVTVLSDGSVTITERPAQAILSVDNLRLLLEDTDIFNSGFRRRWEPPTPLVSNNTFELEKESTTVTMKLKLGASTTEVRWSAPVGVTLMPRPALALSYTDWLRFVEAHRQLYFLIKSLGG